MFEHKNIPIGTLITTYYTGYFILTRIEPRVGSDGKQIGDLYYFTQVADSKGNPRKSKNDLYCDEHFCEVVIPSQIHEEELVSAHKKFKELSKYVN